MKLNKRGISLIVLVITIIVMVIMLSAVVIVLDNSGIINLANKSKFANYKDAFIVEARIELLYMQADAIVSDKEFNKSEYINSLKSKGYEIEKVEFSNVTADDIVILEDGKEIEKIAVRANLNNEIEIKFKEKKNTSYYLKWEGKYFEIKLDDGAHIDLEENALNELPVDYENKFWITPTENPIITIVNGVAINEQIEVKSDTIIRLKATSDSGSSSLKIKCENIEKIYNVDIVMKAEDIKLNPTKYYGKNIINYKQVDGYNDAWEVFFSDGDNIYMITEGGIENNIDIAGYNGTIDFVNDQSKSVEMRRFPAIDKWFGGMMNAIQNDNYELSTDSVKAAEFLLDKTNWLKYADEKISEYAIGGPTIELFSEALVDCGYAAIDYIVEENGYKKNNYTQVHWCEEKYALQHNNYSRYFFMATPSSYKFNTLLNVDYYVEMYSYNYYLRPVVCIKNDVVLKYNSIDGNFEIYNY